MKRVIIVCEGQTEREFCKTILAPYFAKKEIRIVPPLIKASKGGIVKWSQLQDQIVLHLRSDSKAFVSCLIDYYGIKKEHNFPKWEKAEGEPNKNERMTILEQGMKDSIDENFRYRFIPYIQLHEFEGLLFSDIKAFYEQIPKGDLVGKENLESIFDEYDNPEMINNNKETSPSHRLDKIISGYNKVLHGNILAEAIGLGKIRAKSPRFNHWLEVLENLDFGE